MQCPRVEFNTGHRALAYVVGCRCALNATIFIRANEDRQPETSRFCCI
jgi:hypothetical protein